MVKKNYSIDFLRIYMCILICFMHLCNQVLYPFNNNYGIPCINAIGLCVECFFIMSGFFLCLSKKSLKENTLGRIIRLWPLLAFSTIIAGILRLFHISRISLTFEDIQNLLFLQGTGILQGGATNGPAWYVGVLFWVCLALYIIKVKTSILKQFLIIATITISSFLLLWLPPGDIIYNRVRDFVPYTIISVMLARGFAAIGLGYLLGVLQKTFFIKTYNFQFNVYKKLIFTFVEITLLVLFTLVMLKGYTSIPLIYNYFLTLIIFSIMLIIFFNNLGYLSSRVLDNKLVQIGGGDSYSIYIMQNVVFSIISYLVMHNIEFINNNIWQTILYSMLLFIFVGIISKHIVDYIIKSVSEIVLKYKEKK